MAKNINEENKENEKRKRDCSINVLHPASSHDQDRLQSQSLRDPRKFRKILIVHRLYTNLWMLFSIEQYTCAFENKTNLWQLQDSSNH